MQTEFLKESLTDIEPLLFTWGQWQRTGSFLGYRNAFFEKRGYTFNDKEMEIADKLLCKVKDKDPLSFEIIKLRYVERYSYRDIMQIKGYKSPKQVGAAIDKALSLFADVIIQELHYE